MKSKLPAFLLFLGLGLPASSQTPLIEEGDTVAGVGNVSSIANLAINDVGAWIVEVDTDNPDTEADGALVADGVLLIAEGAPLAAPAGATLDSFDTVNLNNSGDSGWNFFLDGTSGLSDDSGLYFGLDLLIQEGTVSTAPGFTAGTPYIGFFECKFNDDNRMLVMASVDDPAIGTTVDRALVVLTLDGVGNLVSEEVFAKEGDLLPGQVEVVADFETGPHNFGYSDLGDVLFIADLEGPTGVDHAVYLNDTLLAQEGSPSPVAGRNWATLASAEVGLSDNCEYVISGSLDGDAASNLLIVKNGTAFRQEGDTLAAISPFLLTSFGSGPVLIANSGDVLWYGDWDDADTNVDTGLFVNDTLIVQEGVTTIGGVTVDTLRGVQDGYAISPNGRYVVFEAVLIDGTEGAYLIDRGEIAHQELRNGTGVNPICLKGITRPAIGSTYTTQIDSTNHPGTIAVGIFAHPQPSSGIVLPLGELLVNVATQQLFTAAVFTGGGIDNLSATVPNDVGLIGRTIHIQGLLFGGGAVQLCNALQATAGL